MDFSAALAHLVPLAENQWPDLQYHISDSVDISGHLRLPIVSLFATKKSKVAIVLFNLSCQPLIGDRP